MAAEAEPGAQPADEQHGDLDKILNTEDPLYNPGEGPDAGGAADAEAAADADADAAADHEDTDDSREETTDEKIARLESKNAELEGKNGELQTQVTELQEQVAELQRGLDQANDQLAILIAEVRRRGGDPDTIVTRPPEATRPETGRGREPADARGAEAEREVGPVTDLSEQMRIQGMPAIDRAIQALRRAGASPEITDLARSHMRSQLFANMAHVDLVHGRLEQQHRAVVYANHEQRVRLDEEAAARGTAAVDPLDVGARTAETDGLDDTLVLPADTGAEATDPLVTGADAATGEAVDPLDLGADVATDGERSALVDPLDVGADRARFGEAYHPDAPETDRRVMRSRTLGRIAAFWDSHRAQPGRHQGGGQQPPEEEI